MLCRVTVSVLDRFTINRQNKPCYFSMLLCLSCLCDPQGLYMYVLCRVAAAIGAPEGIIGRAYYAAGAVYGIALGLRKLWGSHSTTL